jgi:hypothetical protein
VVKSQYWYSIHVENIYYSLVQSLTSNWHDFLHETSANRPTARAGIIFLTYKVPTRTHITYFSSLGVHFLRAACLCYYLLMILLCISQLHHSRIHLYLCIFMQAYHRLGLCPSRGRLDSLVSSPCTLSVVLLLYFFRGARII